ALRNGWRDQQNLPRFTGLAAGLDNDVVGLAILGSSRFYVEISGDEPGNTPNPLDGNRDSLALVGRIEATSQLVKFEQGIVLATQVAEGEPSTFDGFATDPTTLTDTTGTEFLTESVGELILDEATLTIQIFLPLVL